MKKNKLFIIILTLIVEVFAQNIHAQTTKTVGTSGTYTTLKAAFDAINAGSIKGAITLQIITNTNETASASLNASGSGSASYSSINIYPTISGLSINGNLNTPLINLNGANNVTIDGRVNGTGSTTSLIISNTNTSAAASTITFINSAANNILKYCTVQGSSTNVSGGVIFFSTATAGIGNSNNTINNCNFTNAGSNRPYNIVYSSGTASYLNSSNTLSNNNIFNFINAGATSYGFHIVGNSTSWSITGNSFYENTTIVPSGAFSYYGIYINNISGNNFTVTGNYIGGSATLCSGTWTINNSAQSNNFFGIYLNVGTTTASNVQNNTISGINLTTSSGVTSAPGIFSGISILAGSVNIGTTSGNTIGTTSGTGNITITSTTSGAYIAGIYANSISSVNIQNNNIASIATNGSATVGYTFYGINTAGAAGNFTISGNNIGNATANSIAIGTNSTSTAATTFFGINNSATGTISITGNTIQNCSSFGSGASVFTGIINSGATASLNINNNTLASNTLAGTGAYTGISNTGAVTSTINLNNNIINSGTLSAATVSGAVTILSCMNAGATSTLSISSNSISGISFTGSTGGTGTFTGINNTGTPLISTINSNNFNNLSLNTTGIIYLINNNYAAPANGTKTVQNNYITNTCTRTAAGTNAFYCYIDQGSSPSTASHTISGNTFSNITINNLNSGGFNGIYSKDFSASNPSLTVYNNTISSVSCGTGAINGIYLNGFSGTSGSPNLINGNTVSNISSASTSVNGLYIGAQALYVNTYNNAINTISTTGVGSLFGIYLAGGIGINAYSNNINSLSSIGSSTAVYGTYIGGGTTNSVYKNKIYNLTSSGSAALAYGYYVTGGITNNFYNNFISDIKTPASTYANAVAGIYLNTGSTAGTTNNIFYNTIYLNATSTGTTFGSSGIYSSTTPTLSLINNNIINLSSPGSNSGYTAALRFNNATLTNYASNSNNNNFYAGTPGTRNVIFYNGTTSYQTMANFEALVAPRDAASVTENTTFVNTATTPYDLHISSSTPTYCESGGIPITSPIAITDDIDGQPRWGTTGYSGTGTAPDIGADEGNFTPPPIASVSISADPCISSSPIYAGVTVNLTATPTNGGTNPSFQWELNGSNVGTNSSTFSYTPANNDVVQCIMTSNLTCIRGNPSTSNSITFTVNPHQTKHYVSTSSGTDNPCSGSLNNPWLTTQYAINNSILGDTIISENGNGTNQTLIVSNQLLVLSISGYGSSDECKIGFRSDGTIRFNGNLDAYKWWGYGGSELCANTISPDSSEVAIYYLPNNMITNVTIPIEINLGSLATYTIKASNLFSFDSTLDITLIDLDSNAFTKLNQTSSYSFSSNSVSEYKRFFIHFGTIISNTGPYCPGNTINLSFSIDSMKSYSWSGPNGYRSNSQNPIIYNATAAMTGVYTVKAVTKSNDTITFTTNVTVNPKPIITVNGGSVCYGTSLVISAGGANTYNWSYGLGSGSSQTVNPTITTAYIVTGTSNNCTNTAQGIVTVNSLPTVTAGGGGTICNGASISISAGGANTYNWSNELGTGSPKTVTPATSTTYTVTGTSNNCTNTAQTIITVNSLPTVTADGGAICIGSSFNITAGGADTYYWNGGLGSGPSKIVSPTISTSYTVSGTNSSNCINTAQAIVTVNNLPTVMASGGTICSGYSINITASGANTYNWSNGLGSGSSILVNPASSTIYTVTGTNANNCTNTAQAFVIVNNLPTVTASGGTICSGYSISIAADGANTYSWSNGLGNGSSKIVNPTISTTYNVTGTTNNCTNIALSIVTVNPNPTADAGQNQSICSTASASLTATGGGTYQWSTGETLASIIVSPAVTTTYTVTVTNAELCTSTANVVVSLRGGRTITSINSGSWLSAATWNGGVTPGPCDNVVIASGHTITIGSGSVVSCFGLTISANGVLNSTSNTLTLNGDFVNNGIFNHNNGSINFAGNSILSGSTATSFKNVIITGTLTATNFNVAGNWTNNGAFNHNTNGTITFNGNIPSGNTGGSLYSGSATTAFYNVNISAGCGLTIQSAKAMNITQYLRLYASSPSAIGQLVLQDNSASLNVGNYIWIQSYIANTNWHSLSSPFSSDKAAPYLTGYYVTKFDEPTNSYIYLKTSDSLKEARGYFVKASSSITTPATITFSGINSSVLNNGSITYPVINNGNGGGFNMIGNPYPCTIDWEAANGWNCSNLDGYIYTWTGSTFATYSNITHVGASGGSRYLAPLQGAFVRTMAASGQWGMDNRVRVAYNQSLSKKGTNESKGSPSDILTLHISGFGYSDESIIGFRSDATDGFDPMLDAPKLFSFADSTPQINTLTPNPDSIQLSNNFVPLSQLPNMTILVELTAKVKGNYTISTPLLDFDSTVIITLIDLKKNVSANLRDSSYTFYSDIVNSDKRFLVHFGNIISDTSTYCAGNTINLSYAINGMKSYSWSGPNGFKNTSQNPAINNATTAMTGIYTVSATSNTNYLLTAITNVIINVNPIVSAVGGTICNGDSVSITAGGANTYAWNNNLGSGSSEIVKPTITEIYTVTGTDINNCSNTAQAVVNVNQLPTVNATNGNVCIGASTNIFASGASSYIWNNDLGSGSSKTVNPTGNTTYTLTGTDSKNCSNTAQAVVTVNSLPTITATGGTICNGDILTITPNGADTYNWSNGLGTGLFKSVSPVTNTTYTVTGTVIATGCINTAQAIIIVNPLPVVTATALNSLICSGGSTVITAEGTINYLWSGNLGNGSSVSVSPTETTVYSVTGTDMNNCVNTAQTLVTVTSNNLIVTADISGLNPICAGNSTTLSANGAATYNWSNDLGTGDSKTVAPDVTTSYIVSGTAPGCTNSSTAQVIITINPLPTVTASDTIICSGYTANIFADGANSYAWSNNLGSGSSKTVNPLLTTTYTITGTDANGCSNIAQSIVTVNLLPAILTSGNITCTGSIVNISASGADSYSWSDNLGTNPLQSVSPMATTTYTVTGTDFNNCSNIAQAVVLVYPLPIIVTDASITICSGVSTTITAGGASSYIWNNNLGTSSSIIIKPTLTTTYLVTGTDNNNCSNTAQSVVLVDYLPATPHIIQMHDTLFSDASSGNQWFNTTGMLNNETNSFYIPKVTDSYHVVVTNDCGFAVSNTILVVITDIIEKNNEENILIYPNPASGKINIAFVNSNEQLTIELLNSIGQVVLSKSINTSGNNNLEQLDLTGMATGIYFVKIQLTNNSIVKKIIKE